MRTGSLRTHPPHWRRSARLPRSRRRWRLRVERLEPRLLLTSVWSNGFTRLDVDANGLVTPRDVLLIVNELNRDVLANDDGSLPIPPPDPPPPPFESPLPPPFFDTNGDGFLTPRDALAIINQLNHDAAPPSINVGLVHDTAPAGGTNQDTITSDARLAGVVADPLGVVSLQAQVFVITHNDPQPGEKTRTPIGGTVQLAFDAGGNFSFDPDLPEDGEYAVEFTAVDGRFNAHGDPRPDVELTLDTSAPAAPHNLRLTMASDAGVSPTDGVTNVAQPDVAGDVADAAFVQLLLGGEVVGGATVSGSFSLPLNEPLGDGGYELVATADDLAGNTSLPSDPLAIVIDTVHPELQIATPQPGGQHLGFVSLAGSTSDSGSTLVSLTQELDNQGPLAVDVDAQGLFASRIGEVLPPAGSHELTVAATDAAGNVELRTITFDVLAGPPLLEVATTDGFQPAASAVVADVTPTFRLTGQPTGARVFHRRPDGHGDPPADHLGREVTSQFSLVESSLQATLPVLVGANTLMVTDSSTEHVLSTVTMLNYSTSYEDLNQNGTLDAGEDVNANGVLDAGEDTNGNQLLDFAEDFNLNGQLDTAGVVPLHPVYAGDVELIEDAETTLAFLNGSLVLHFDPSAGDGVISGFLRNHGLDPIGFSVDEEFVQVTVRLPGSSPFGPAAPADVPLALQWERFLNGRGPLDETFPQPDEQGSFPLRVAIVDLLASERLEVASESLPQRLRQGAAAVPSNGNLGDRYNPHNGGFDNNGSIASLNQDIQLDEVNIAWPNFVTDLHAAHRLVDEIPASPGGADAINMRPVLAVVDTGISDGTNKYPDIPGGANTRRYMPTRQLGPTPVVTTFSGLADDPQGPHGAATTAFAAGDGSMMVLGPGKDVRVRPVQVGRFRIGTTGIRGGTVQSIGYSLQTLAADAQTSVINLSWGSEVADLNGNGTIDAGRETQLQQQWILRDSRLLRAGINALIARNTDQVGQPPTPGNDIIVTIAAGNELADANTEWAASQIFNVPARGARLPGQANSLFMTVSASDLDDATTDNVAVPEAFADFSNKGAQVSVAAPGGFHLRGYDLQNRVFHQLAGVTATTLLDLPTATLTAAMTNLAPATGGSLNVNQDVAANPNFPAQGYLMIDGEIISYTGRITRRDGTGAVIGGAFTGIVRNALGTAAAGHIALSQVELIANHAVAPAPARGIIPAFPANGGRLAVNDVSSFPATGVLLLEDGSGAVREAIRYTGITNNPAAPDYFTGIQRGFDGVGPALHVNSSIGRRGITANCPGVAANCPFGTNLQLDSVVGFPAVGVATVDREQIFYGAIVGNQLQNVVRGVGGTARTIHQASVRTGKITRPRYVTAFNNGYQFQRIAGTSMAAPMVAGLAAELLYLDSKSNQVGALMGGNRNTDLTPYQIVEIIEATADDLGSSQPLVKDRSLVANDAPGNGPDHRFGFGRINAWKAALTVANGGLAEVVSEDFNRNGSLDLGPDSNPAVPGLQDTNGNGFPGETGEDLNDNGAIDNLFASLPIVAEADTEWYGFRIVTSVKGAGVSIDGDRAADRGAMLPDPNRPPGNETEELTAYKGVRSSVVILNGVRNPGDEVLDEDPTSGTIPVGTRVNNRGEYVITFSIADDDLDRVGGAKTLTLRRPGGNFSLSAMAAMGTNTLSRAAGAPQILPGRTVIIGSGATREQRTVTAVSADQLTLTLDRPLTDDHAAGQPVSVSGDVFFNLKLELDKLRAGKVPGVTFDDFVFEITPADFGDAPDDPANPGTPYPSLYKAGTANGARHLNTNLEWFGQPGNAGVDSVSQEPNAAHLNDADAPGADVDVDGVSNLILENGSLKAPDLDRHDDGVLFFPLTYLPGETGKVQFTVCAADPDSPRYAGAVDQSLYVNGWIDWSGSGGWEETGGEHIVDGLQLNPRGSWEALAGDDNVTPRAITDNCREFEATFPIPETVAEELWARFRVDYGENLGRNDPRPGFRSDPSLRDAALAVNQPQSPGTTTGYTYGAARFGEVEDYRIGADFGTAPDPFMPPRDPPGEYPTFKDNAGARHLDIHHEWLGPTKTAETDGLDGDNDGVEVPLFVLPLITYTIDVTVNTTLSTAGYEHATEATVKSWDPAVVNRPCQTPTIKDFSLPITPADSLGKGRYNGLADREKLWLNGWADWNGDGVWSEGAEHIMQDIPIAPETFGKDGAYTLGEAFTDTNGDGVFSAGLDTFTAATHDAAGVSVQKFSCTVTVPLEVAPTFWWRFRLDYGEKGATDHQVVHQATEETRVLDDEKGGALFGEVEDYKSVQIPFKLFRPPHRTPGQDTVVRIGITNPTDQPVQFQIVDPLPDGLTLVPDSVQCDENFEFCQGDPVISQVQSVGQVPPHEVALLEFTVTVAEGPGVPQVPFEIINCATVVVESDVQDACAMLFVEPLAAGFRPFAPADVTLDQELQDPAATPPTGSDADPWLATAISLWQASGIAAGRLGRLHDVRDAIGTLAGDGLPPAGQGALFLDKYGAAKGRSAASTARLQRGTPPSDDFPATAAERTSASDGRLDRSIVSGRALDELLERDDQLDLDWLLRDQRTLDARRRSFADAVVHVFGRL